MSTKAKLALLVGAAILSTGCAGTLTPAPQAPPQAPPVQPAQPPSGPIPGEIPPVPQVTPTAPVSPPDNNQKSANVDFLKRVFNAMDSNQKSEVTNSWSSVKGSPQLEDAFLFEFVRTINDNGTVSTATGKPLTNGEAREFLDWTLTQGTT